MKNYSRNGSDGWNLQEDVNEMNCTINKIHADNIVQCGHFVKKRRRAIYARTFLNTKQKTRINFEKKERKKKNVSYVHTHTIE